MSITTASRTASSTHTIFQASTITDASDYGGHGSNIAGIIASRDTTYGGMAPGVNIIALKVFPDSEGGANTSDISEALDWVVANRAAYNVVSVNMSLSFGDKQSRSVALGEPVRDACR